MKRLILLLLMLSNLGCAASNSQIIVSDNAYQIIKEDSEFKITCRASEKDSILRLQESAICDNIDFELQVLHLMLTGLVGAK